MGRPGLLGTAARTAVVVGTANAVTNAQSGRLRAAQQPVQQAPQPAPVAPPPPPPAAAPAPANDLIAQLDQLAQLRAAGVLTDDEFAAAALDSHVRATDGIVYATALGPAVTLLRLKTDPTPFRVDVRERFWEDLLPTPQTGLVPSVLIYGDVLRDGDARSRDIAANLRRNDAHLRTLG